MADVKEHIDELVRDLTYERDRLRVKLGLAKLEAMDEWRDLEKKFGKLESKAKEIGGATAEASKEIGAAASLLGQEIRKGLESIAKRI